jgi:hypothetical protein
MKQFRITSIRGVHQSTAEDTPRLIGEIVMLNSGSPWGLLVDVNGDECTVGLKQDGVVKEYVVPCAAMRRVWR